MSYEGDLATHYNAIHQKLIGSPTVVPIPSSFPRQPTTLRNELEAILLRIQAIEERITALESPKKKEVKLENIVIIYPQYPQGKDRCLGEIFKLVKNNEQHLDPSTDLRTMELLGPKRHKTLSRVRHLMYYLMSNTTTKSLPEIGRFMKRDHTSVMHGRDKIAALRLRDDTLDLKLRWYEAEIARLWAIRDKSVKSVDKNPATLTPVAETP